MSVVKRVRARLTPEVLERVVADLLLLNIALLGTILLRFLWLFQSKGEVFTLSRYVHIMRESFAVYQVSAVVLSALCLVVFSAAGFYTYGRAYRGRYKMLLILGAVTAAYLLFALVAVPVLSLTPLPRSVLLGSWLATLGLLEAARVWSYLWKRTMHVETRRDHSNAHPKVRNVLIIGGAGYIGSILTRGMLRRGYNVTVLDALLYGDEGIRDLYREPGFEFIKGDLRDIEAVVGATQGNDAVVHLAALVGDPACAVDERLTLEINLAATRVIAEVAKGFGVRRFVFASTCSVYGTGNGLLTEDSPLNPVSLYARSKIASEEALLALADDRFSPTVLRFATIFGLSPRARFDLVVNTLAAQAAAEKKIVIQGGSQWRPFIHVEDVAEAIVRCMETPETVVKGEVFNVGSDRENYQIGQMADLIRAAVPDVEVQLRDGEVDPRDYRVSFRKFHEKTGFVPRRRVAEGIHEIVSAVRSGLIRNFRDPHYSNYKTLLDEATVEGFHREEPWTTLYPPEQGELQRKKQRRGRKILMVDDDEMLLNLTQSLLSDRGYTVLVAASGEEGIAAYRKHEPDLVLLDLGLPDMTGMQVLQTLRTVNGHAKVIIVTAHGALESSEAFRAGAIDYIRKPFDINDFYQQIDAAVLDNRHHITVVQS